LLQRGHEEGEATGISQPVTNPFRPTGSKTDLRRISRHSENLQTSVLYYKLYHPTVLSKCLQKTVLISTRYCRRSFPLLPDFSNFAYACVIQNITESNCRQENNHKELCHPNGVSTHLNQLTILQKVMSSKWCFHAPQSTDHFTKSYVIQMVFQRTSINWQFYKELCHPNGVSTHLNQLTILQRDMSSKWCFNAPQSTDNFTKRYVIQMVFPRNSMNWQFYKELQFNN